MSIPYNEIVCSNLDLYFNILAGPIKCQIAVYALAGSL